MRSSLFDPAASTGRQSPFRRQNSASPATARATTPTTSPTKATISLSPTKPGSLSPEKTSPFVRRPSQVNATDRPASPLPRPNSHLSLVSTPPRKTNEDLRSQDVKGTQMSPPRTANVTPALDETPRNVAPSATYGLDGDHQTSLSSEGSRAAQSSIPSRRPGDVRSAGHGTVTSPTTSRVEPPPSRSQPKWPAPKLNAAGGAYNHVPQPLLHSMRESFEVLDSNNTGAVTSASVSDMLSQLGLDNHPSALRDFFPPNGPAQLNLARYLDTLSGPFAELSQPDELQAAFEAFDVDDSGQIDIGTLRDALLSTAPQPGVDNHRLNERDVDAILGEFTGRRAFGAKGLNAARSTGDVFKYRDFMANVSGGALAVPGADTAAVV